MRKILLKYKKRGFSLVELLVVTAIIALLSLVIYTNQRSGQSQYLLTQGTQKMVSDLRRAQNMAMSGAGIHATYYGYGIYFPSGGDSYVLYGEKTNIGANSTIYNPSGGAQDEVIETISFPRNVSLNSPPFPSGVAHVFFKPPDPVVSISDGTDSSKAEVLIVLKVSGLAATETVKVTNAGLIEAQ